MKGKTMTKTDIAKKIARNVVGYAVGSTSTMILARLTEPKNTREKVEVVIGGTVIGMMASDAASDYTDKKIDDFIEQWKNAFGKN